MPSYSGKEYKFIFDRRGKMFHTGLKKFETMDIDNFTSASGIKVRRKVNRVWRKILSLATHRKVV